MSSDHLSFENANALGEGSQGTFDQADGMRHDIQMLVDEVESIPQAIRGTAETPFTGAGRGLGECFAELLTWCQTNGMNMSEAQNLLNTINDESAETFSTVANQISSLSRGVNA